MKIQEKPDYLIFADSAKNGECVKFPDVSRGWGVTIDQTASKPPLEWMNGAFNRIDKNMMYLLQQGVPEWCEYVKYPVNAIIKYNGVLYTAIVENDNAIPTTSDKWKKTIAEIPNASTNQIGVIKLNSAINSISETEAATPLAIKTVNDNVIFAHDRINQVHHYSKEVDGRVTLVNNRITDVHEYAKSINNEVVSAHDRINQVHGFSVNVNERVNSIVDRFQPDYYETRIYSHDKRFYIVIRDDGTTGMYSHVKNEVTWFINHDGWVGGYIDCQRVTGLDQFVRDRTLPVGVPMMWPQTSPPTGYFECNGSTFDKNQFPKLSDVYPSGKLPDLRGEFIRGWDHGRGIDPNRNILGYQSDAIRNITGTFGFESALGGNTGVPPVNGAFYDIADANRKHISAATGGTNSTVVFDASRVVPVAHENRPRNIAFMYIVKAE